MNLTTAVVLGAALPDHPSLLDNLEFQAVGLVIVMGALFLLYLLCALIGRVFVALEQRGRVSVSAVAATGAEAAAELGAPPPAEPAPAAQEQSEGEIPAAVIAAAVAAAVDKPHRVVAIKPVTTGWSLEGRRQLLTSHQLKR